MSSSQRRRLRYLQRPPAGHITGGLDDPAHDFVEEDFGVGPSNDDILQHSHRRHKTAQGLSVSKSSGIPRPSRALVAASAPASPTPSSGGPQDSQESVDPHKLAQDNIIPCPLALPPNLYPKKIWCAVFATPPPRLNAGIFFIPGVRYAREDQLWRINQATSFPFDTLSSWRKRGAILDNSEGVLYFVLNLLPEDAVTFIANNHLDTHCREVMSVWLNKALGWRYMHSLPKNLSERLYEKRFYWCGELVIQS